LVKNDKPFGESVRLKCEPFKIFLLSFYITFVSAFRKYLYRRWARVISSHGQFAPKSRFETEVSVVQ